MSTNHFDQFDGPSRAANYFDKFDDTPKPKRSLIDAIKPADKAIAFGAGALQGVKMISDAFGAGNAVSQALGSGVQALEDRVSDERKAEKQQRAQIIRAAEDSGSTWEEVKAYAGGFAEAPVESTLNAAGTILPTAAAALLTRGNSLVAQLGVHAPRALGALQGAGAVKGGIYDAVEQQHKEAGLTPEEAAARAEQAQAYSGANAGNIALGAGLGLLASSTGVEGAVGRMAGKAAAAGAAKNGLLKQAGLGVAKEAPMEMAQGGQERLASNVALQRDGFDVPTWQGVAGQAVQEGLASAPLGGGFGVAEGLKARREAVRKPSEDLGLNPDSGPISKVAAAAVDEGRAAAPMQPEQATQPEDGLSLVPEEQAQPQGPTMAERLAALPEQARAQADQLLREIADERVPVGVKRFRAHELQQVLDAYPVTEKTDTITPEERAAMGPIVRGYDPATGEVPGRPLELEGERYQDGIDFATDEQPSQSAYQEAINRIALESYQTPGQPLAMEQASRLRDAAQEQGIPATIVPHPSGRGFDVQATAVLPEDARQQVAQDPVAAALPYDNSPTGRMVADTQGNARPELRPEAVGREVRWNQELAQMDAEARRRAELGLSNRTPVTPLQEDAAPQQPQSPGPLAPQGGRQPAAQQPPQDVQFQASTGRDVAVRNAPGLENAPIDVEASEVHPNPALGMTRRLSYGSDGQSLEQGQEAAAQPGPGRAGTQQQTPPALPGPSNLRERIEAFRQKQAGAARMAQQVGQAPGTAAAALPAPAADAKQVAASAQPVSTSALNDAENVSSQALAAIETEGAASPAANLRERLERFRQKRAEASAAVQQPVPPESGTSLAGAQITARQAQQAGAKARQQAKQAQRQAERAQAAPEETGLRVGVAPGSADPVTVRDGVVHIGEYEAVNYDTGEPVTVPKGSTRADVARALKDAGVLSSRQKMFGLSEKAQEVMFSRSAETKAAYESRIDALFAGEKPALDGVRVLDSSDMLGLLGMGNGPVHLAEGKVNASKHPNMTAQEWKKIPQWLDNPAAVFDSATVSGRLVLVAPETVNNAPVLMVVEPNGQKKTDGVRVHLLQNAYDKDESAPPFGRWLQNGKGRYVSQKEFPAVLNASGLQLSSTAWQNKPGMRRILTEKHLAGYRKANSTDILYSKSAKPVTNPTAVKLRRAMVQRTVDALAKGWAKAPNVTVVDSMQDERVPEAVRKADAAQRSQGAMGEPEGFWYRGQVYLVASALPTSADAARVLYHEVLGHHGLRGHFGKDLDRVLDQVIKLRRKDVQAKAQEYGLDMSNPEHAGYAAEEVLAELAQSRPDLGFVQRAIAAIRNFLRTHVPGFKVLELTDADIVQGYLLPARGWVERGADAGSAADGPMLSRSGGPDTEAQRQFKETERAYGGKAAYDRAKAAGKTKLTHGQWVQVRTPNFKEWFGDWEVQSSNSVVNQQIEQWASGELPANVILNIGHPSSVLTQHGVPNMPITLRQAILRKAVKDKHGVAAAQLKDIAQAVQAPTAIFDDPDNPGTRIAVTEIRHTDGNIIAAIRLNTERDGLEINDIRSIHPKRDSSVLRWVEDGLLLGLDKKKGRDWLENLAATNPQQPQADFAALDSILYDAVTVRNASKVVDAETGEPLVVYHGTGADFSVFDGKKRGSHTREVDARKGFFLSSSPEIASEYAEEAGANGGANIMPAYVSLQNALVIDEGGRDYDAERFRDYIDQAQEQGHDGVLLRNTGDGMFKNGRTGDTVIAFRSEQIKSATGNNGNFDATSPDIRFSRSQSSDAIRSSMGQMTPDQEAAWKKVAGLEKVPTLRERWESLKANLGTRMKQALVDQFAPIAELDQHAYMLARMSKGSDGTLEAALLYGRPFLRDGVPDVDVKEGGFAKVLAGLKGEQDRFLMWVAAQRAENLKAQGKENLFSDQDISSLKTLNDGQMQDGSSRKQTYAKALMQLNSFNESVLRMAKESGLIDQAAYDLMKDQPYVPFYRLMEDEGGLQGPTFSKGLTNQKAWKKLKGGTQQLNADLLQNMLLNWGNLYAASARNRAALATMDAAEKMAIAYKVPSDTKGAAKVMRDGVTEHWMVEDPYLLEAISALNYQASPLMKPLAKAKQWLTFGVTVNPTFKVRNLIRDVVSSMAIADLSYNPAANIGKGWKLTARDSQVYASMLASGGVIKFGSQEQTDRARQQAAKLSGVVLDQTAGKKLWGQLKALYEVYDDFGDRAENINRAALYDRLIQKGHSHAEASFMARDLMDFSMSGSAPVVRFLTQSVPFLNARMQGLYKLGRAAKEDPRRFATVAMAVSVASLGLLAAYADDEDWKRREDWDRDSYWWFKIGDTAYRIPKPFEVGAIGTLAERTAEAMFDDEMDSKRFMERISHMVSQTFAFDPIPQAVKPLLDIYANKDSFTGRVIESMADQRLRPQDRYNEKTSEVARLLGQMGLPDPAQLVKGEYVGLSPKQIDHLLRGYFSWMATAATTASDALLRHTVVDRGEAPDLRLKDMLLVGNFAENLPAGGSRYVTALYEQSRAIEQAYASYQDAMKSGERDKAAEIMESEGDKIRSRGSVAAATKLLSQLNAQAKRVQEDREMSGEEKRARLTQLEQRRHEIAKRVMGG